jgi:hypothetical protein
MKKEVLKHMKKKTRENLGPIPPPKVEPTKKQYNRKKIHPPKEDS